MPKVTFNSGSSNERHKNPNSLNSNHSAQKSPVVSKVKSKERPRVTSASSDQHPKVKPAQPKKFPKNSPTVKKLTKEEYIAYLRSKKSQT